MLLLMTNELVVTLKDQETLFTLVVEAGGASESSRAIVSRVQRRLVFVDLPRFLSCVLEPNHNHPRRQAQKFRQVFQVVVFRVGVVLEELLQNFDLVIVETCSVGSLSRTTCVSP